jgi:dephospho-CoA kinase
MKRVTTYLNTKAIGVTGGIGSGQSTVCQILARLGCKVIDLDLKARQLINRDHLVQNELKKVFGANVFSDKNVLDRHRLAQIVFHDEEKLHNLNRIVHPRLVPIVIEEMESARFSHKYPLVIMDAALIYEINLEPTFDAIVVVYCTKKNRIDRILKRDQITHQEAVARINSQIPLEEKKEWAEYVIDNNGTIEDLEEETKKIFNQLVEDIPVQRKIRIE